MRLKLSMDEIEINLRLKSLNPFAAARPCFKRVFLFMEIYMEKCSPVDMRKPLEMARALADAGIRFVPMPVSDDIEAVIQMEAAMSKLESMEVEADE